MIEITNVDDQKRLRRITLAAQGLLQDCEFGDGLSGALNAVRHIGYVQLDTISVVERAHHHVFFSRVPDFTPLMTDQLLADRNVFEYWSHAAALIPMSDFRFSLPYKHAIQNGKVHWYKNCDRKLMDSLLERIRLDGPLRSRDLENLRTKRAGWWDWKPAKKALEQLYMEGHLMVSGREGFQKTYDLTERVFPPSVNSTMPTVDEFANHLLEQHLRCHGVVSQKGITYLRKNADLRKAVKRLLSDGVRNNTLEELRLKTGERYVMKRGAFELPLSCGAKCLKILSPFDNAVIQRDRLKSLFGYDYQIECYVPAAKRRFGYFCLPLLYDDALVGRMDCKAHRKIHQLEIKALHLEEGVIEDEMLVEAFVKSILKFCQFQQCDSVVFTGGINNHLCHALNELSDCL